ncbi:MAG: dihydroorotase [Candidatus Omnitrophica bacterium]|nr:dihydroorotase [Candidatus Omnitrophota bacterium]
MSLLVKGARVISPGDNLDKEIDILIKKGVIEKIAKGIKAPKAKIINAKGKVAVPGLIDMHTHLREPGREDKESLYTGSLAAVAGGFTAVACMANTNPPLDSEQDMEYIYTEAKKIGLVDILPIAAVTKNMEQKELTEAAKLKKAGAVALSEDGHPILNSSFMRHALEYANMYGLIIICHCEDKALSAGGVMNEGYMSSLLGLKGIPAEAEAIIVSRDINLARRTSGRIHIAHVSCKESVALIRQAKKEGVKITAETCPHYFSLSDEELKEYDANFKVNPPLRAKEDIAAIKEALADNTIDIIVSDHAPHLESEKELEFDRAPFGMTGLETSLGVSYGLVEEKVLSLGELVNKMSVRPAGIFGLDKGSLKEGDAADITVIDLSTSWVVKKENFKSKGGNSAFIGKELKARATEVIFSGRLVMENGKVL